MRTFQRTNFSRREIGNLAIPGAAGLSLGRRVKKIASRRFRSAGFRRARRILLPIAFLVNLTQAVAQVADADLTQLSIEELLAVPITAASKYEQRQDEIAAAVTVITRQDIKVFGWRTLDEALASLPGIHTTYDRQYGYLGTRGFGLPGDFNTRLLITVDGNRWNDVVYDGAPIDRSLPIDLDLVERIEFIAGPGGAVYGQNAMFGIVNIITRTGLQTDGAEAALAYHSLEEAGTGRFTWGKRLENGLDVVLSATAYHANGQDLFFDFGEAGIAGVARDMDGEKDKELFSSLALGPWSFYIAYGDRRKDDPTASYFSDPLVNGQYQRDRYLLTQAKYQESFAANTLHLMSRLFLGRERYTGLFSYDSPYFATGSSDWQGVEVQLLSTAWAHHKLMLGVEYQDNSRRDQTFEDRVDPANDLDIPGSGWRGGIYAQDEWRLADTLDATLGVRVDRNDVTGTQWSPRVGLIWHASPRTVLKALFGRSHRAPNAYERDYDDSYSQVGNPALDGESIDTWELVTEYRVAADLRLRGSLYHWTMRDLVALGIDPVSGLSQYQSGGDIEAQGVELVAEKSWDWGGRLRTSLSYQDVSGEHGEELPNSPQWLGKLNFSSPLPIANLKLGYELQYYGSRMAISGKDLGHYWLSNLNLVADRLARGLDVSLGVHNLFGEDYAVPGADVNWQDTIAQDGRSVRLKLEYRF